MHTQSWSCSECSPGASVPRWGLFPACTCSHSKGHSPVLLPAHQPCLCPWSSNCRSPPAESMGEFTARKPGVNLFGSIVAETQ